jgi:transposase
MILIPSGLRVWPAVGHTDMRRGMNSLAIQVQQGLKRDPHAGDLYVFRGKRGHLVKILWHDGIGISLYAKRLERGRFIWPSPVDGTVAITSTQPAWRGDTIVEPPPVVDVFWIATQYSERRLWEKANERLAKRTPVFDLIAVTDDDRHGHRHGRQTGAEVCDHDALSPTVKLITDAFAELKKDRRSAVPRLYVAPKWRCSIRKTGPSSLTSKTGAPLSSPAKAVPDDS